MPTAEPLWKFRSAQTFTVALAVKVVVAPLPNVRFPFTVIDPELLVMVRFP